MGYRYDGVVVEIKKCKEANCDDDNEMRRKKG